MYIYPKYRYLCLALGLAFGIPWCLIFSLKDQYGTGIVYPLIVTFFLCVFFEILGQRKYNRLVQKIYGERCDGAAFAAQHARIAHGACKNPSWRVILSTNASIAAWERGEDVRISLRYASRAAEEAEALKGNTLPPVTRAAAFLNCGAYLCKVGELDRAREYLGKLGKVKRSLKPNQPIAWRDAIEQYETRLTYDIRFYGGDCGEEVERFFRSEAEGASLPCDRISYRYDLGTLYLRRGESDRAAAEFRAVVQDGNTLRAARDAKAWLSAQ